MEAQIKSPRSVELGRHQSTKDNTQDKHESSLIAVENLTAMTQRDGKRAERAKKDKRKREKRKNAKSADLTRDCPDVLTLRSCPDANGTEHFCSFKLMRSGRCRKEMFTADKKSRHYYISEQDEGAERALVIERVGFETMKIDAIPTGFTRLELLRVRRLEMHDVVIPDGMHNIWLANGTLDGFPSGHFYNITLPTSVTDVTFWSLKLKTFNPSSWVNVPIKNMVLANNCLKAFDDVTFPPSIELLDLSRNSLQSFARSTLPPSLKTLNLLHNYLRSLSDIPMRNAAALQRLTLSENPIFEIKSTDILPPNLRKLSLVKCKIVSIAANFTFPSTLETLDLTNNRLKAFSPQSLPRSLRQLHLDLNPIREFIIDDALLQQMRNLTTFSADTSRVKCKKTHTKVLVRGKIFACLQPKKAAVVAETSVQSNGALPTARASSVGIVVAICVTVGILLSVFMLVLQRRRRQRQMLSNGSSFNSTDESSQGFESMDDRESAPMDAMRSSAPSRESLHIEDDQALAPWILPDGAIQDVIPNIGNIASGVYRGGRVMLLSLPEDSAEVSAQLIPRVSHPKLVTFVGFTHGIAGELQVVTEWMDGGTLDALLSKQVLLGLMQKLVVALDVITGLNYLHQAMDMPHRNLSTLTIWLDDGARAKLSLWSCSEPKPQVWHAPEIKTSASNGSYQADMYSYGVLLWTFAAPSDPIRGRTRALEHVVHRSQLVQVFQRLLVREVSRSRKLVHSTRPDATSKRQHRQEHCPLDGRGDARSRTCQRHAVNDSRD
ncbi:hypothetical protein Ae201684_003965 [Aphanomyces euteiches]|uniref:Protein kinase domain-containing protein n=1 Tax=Aphanomyces euteiches TaxID=100861 RepID=A0A6G0XJN9_9STRA|nr:hypothetical protein Ae201684_003965 [Aphanomyces euteiches]